MARRSPSPPAPATTRAVRDDRPEDPDAEFARLGECLRRIALGLTAALIVARAYWPGEGVRREEDSGAGLLWTWAVLLTAALGVASMLVGGRTRTRWSLADGFVYILTLLIGLSATRGAERRVAINQAWELAGVGIAYALVRNLPRSRGESSALAGALMATAVAVSAYGLYQNAVELPAARAFYRAHPREAMRIAEVTPDTPQQWLFESRLMEAGEPNSTFALTNSLAGFLVGPAVLGLAIGLEFLRRREDRKPLALLLGALPWLVIVACLLMTKSRSAYAGLVASALVLGLGLRKRLPPRTIVLAGAGAFLLLTAMVAAGVALRKLDREIFATANRTLLYRAQYWQGAWDVITQEPGAWWGGVGPGNFGDAYLRHKRPEASEEVSDPHNLVLEIWTTAGVGAAVALVMALGLGLRDGFAPSRDALDPEASGPGPGADKLPVRSAWLVVSAGAGWLLAWPLGGINLFAGDTLPRWLVLGLGWWWAVLLGVPAWRRVSIPAAGLGAAALAIAINLLAAGGIGFAPVALALGTALALAQNLRDERPCGQLRDAGGRLPAFGLAAGCAAILGSYSGAVGPAWRAEAAMDQARFHLRKSDFRQALLAVDRAIDADRYATRPYLLAADVEYRAWLARGALAEDAVWFRIDADLLRAVTRPRNPNSMHIRRLEANYARDILQRFGGSLKQRDADWLRNRIADALGRAVPLYPTSASLRAEYAEALADIGRRREAIREAEEALRLDRMTSHIDKMLLGPVRDRLREGLRHWAAPKPLPRP